MNNEFEKYSEIKDIIKNVFNDAKEKEEYEDLKKGYSQPITKYREKYTSFDDWYEEKGKHIINQLMNLQQKEGDQ